MLDRIFTKKKRPACFTQNKKKTFNCYHFNFTNHIRYYGRHIHVNPSCSNNSGIASNTKKAAIQSAPINLSSNTAPQSQRMNTVRKVQAANNSFQVKTNQVQNDKQGLSIKNEQNKKQILKKRLPLPMISKIDSN